MRAHAPVTPCCWLLLAMGCSKATVKGVSSTTPLAPSSLKMTSPTLSPRPWQGCPVMMQSSLSGPSECSARGDTAVFSSGATVIALASSLSGVDSRRRAPELMGVFEPLPTLATFPFLLSASCLETLSPWGAAFVALEVEGEAPWTSWDGEADADACCIHTQVQVRGTSTRKVNAAKQMPAQTSA